jgi:heptosyltransferase-2
MRQKWPDARIMLLTGMNAAELMQNCPYVDEIMAFNPQGPGNSGLNLYLRLVPELRRREIDTAFIYHTSMHAALSPWFARVPYRVGWAGFERRDALLSEALPYDTDRNEVHCNLDMVKHVAPDAVLDDSVELWLTHEELADIPTVVRFDDPMAGLQPGATNDGKRWPAAYFAKLAERLLEDGIVSRIAVLGGGDEVDAAVEMISACSEKTQSRIINLVGRTNLRQSLAVMNKLKLFIGNDTAIRHITVALDVPSIGLFGPTNSHKWGNHKPPRQQIIVSPTRQMKDISPESVLQQVGSLFETPSKLVTSGLG